MKQQADEPPVPDPHTIRNLVREVVARVEVSVGRVVITFNACITDGQVGIKSKKFVDSFRARLPTCDRLVERDQQFILTIPVRLRLRGGIKRVDGWDQADWKTPTDRHDLALIQALAQAHEWREMIERGEVLTLEDLVARTEHHRSHVRRILKLAFLAPDIQRAILTGRQPKSLTLATLADIYLPLLWQSQALCSLSRPPDSTF